MKPSLCRPTRSESYAARPTLLIELHDGGARALGELRAAGRIGGFGAGINELGMIPRFLDLIDVDFFLVALPYTLLYQQVLDREFPRCAKKGVGFVIGAVFGSGLLATGAVQGARYAYAPAAPEMLAKVAGIEAVCTRHGVRRPPAPLRPNRPAQKPSCPGDAPAPHTGSDLPRRTQSAGPSRRDTPRSAPPAIERDSVQKVLQIRLSVNR